MNFAVICKLAVAEDTLGFKIYIKKLIYYINLIFKLLNNEGQCGYTYDNIIIPFMNSEDCKNMHNINLIVYDYDEDLPQSENIALGSAIIFFLVFSF